MINNYLNILEDSLKKKIDVLKRIGEVNDAQIEVLKEESVDLESFDRLVDEKDRYIDELTKLDEGFEALYDNVKQELTGNRQKYTEQIRKLQELITQITDKSVSIQAQEARNKALVEKCFKRERQKLGNSRKKSQAVYGYYQNMSNIKDVQPQFMDKKK